MDLPLWYTKTQYFYSLKNLWYIADIQGVDNARNRLYLKPNVFWDLVSSVERQFLIHRIELWRAVAQINIKHNFF